MPNPVQEDRWRNSIGKRVVVDRRKEGTLAFYGPVSFRDKAERWCGVILDLQQGDNDGVVSGRSYFTCEPGYGLLVPLEKVVFKDPTDQNVRPSRKGSSPGAASTSPKSTASPGSPKAAVRRPSMGAPAAAPSSSSSASASAARPASAVKLSTSKPPSARSVSPKRVPAPTTASSSSYSPPAARSIRTAPAGQRRPSLQTDTSTTVVSARSPRTSLTTTPPLLPQTSYNSSSSPASYSSPSSMTTTSTPSTQGTRTAVLKPRSSEKTRSASFSEPVQDLQQQPKTQPVAATLKLRTPTVPAPIISPQAQAPAAPAAPIAPAAPAATVAAVPPSSFKTAIAPTPASNSVARPASASAGAPRTSRPSFDATQSSSQSRTSPSSTSSALRSTSSTQPPARRSVDITSLPSKIVSASADSRTTNPSTAAASNQYSSSSRPEPAPAAQVVVAPRPVSASASVTPQRAVAEPHLSSFTPPQSSRFAAQSPSSSPQTLSFLSPTPPRRSSLVPQDPPSPANSSAPSSPLMSTRNMMGSATKERSGSFSRPSTAPGRDRDRDRTISPSVSSGRASPATAGVAMRERSGSPANTTTSSPSRLSTSFRSSISNDPRLGNRRASLAAIEYTQDPVLLGQADALTSRIEAMMDSAGAPPWFIPIPRFVPEADLLQRMEAAIVRMEVATRNASARAASLSASTTQSRASYQDASRGSMSASSSSAHGGSLRAYDEVVGLVLLNFLEASRAVGSDVDSHSRLFAAAFDAHRAFIEEAIARPKPDGAGLRNMLQPLIDAMKVVMDYRRSNRESKFPHHLCAIGDAVAVLNWVAIDQPPLSFIKDTIPSAEFYTNRILQQFKATDQTHVVWAKSLVAVLNALLAYVKQCHVPSLAWGSSKGGLPRSVEPITSAVAAPSPLAPPASEPVVLRRSSLGTNLTNRSSFSSVAQRPGSMMGAPASEPVPTIAAPSTVAASPGLSGPIALRAGPAVTPSTASAPPAKVQVRASAPLVTAPAPPTSVAPRDPVTPAVAEAEQKKQALLARLRAREGGEHHDATPTTASSATASAAPVAAAAAAASLALLPTPAPAARPVSMIESSTSQSRVGSSTSRPASMVEAPVSAPVSAASKYGSSSTEKCSVCGQTVYVAEKLVADNIIFHVNCFKCRECGKKLGFSSYAKYNSVFYCYPHFNQLFKSVGNYGGSTDHTQVPAQLSGSESESHSEPVPLPGTTAAKSALGTSSLAANGRPASWAAPSRPSAQSSAAAPTPASSSVAPPSASRWGSTPSDKCVVCSKTVYQAELLSADNSVYHQTCFRCKECGKKLDVSKFARFDGSLYCEPHFNQLCRTTGSFGGRAQPGSGQVPVSALADVSAQSKSSTPTSTARPSSQVYTKPPTSSLVEPQPSAPASASKWGAPPTEKCVVCLKSVYVAERLFTNNAIYHIDCFRCAECGKKLGHGRYSNYGGRIYCEPHFNQLYKSTGTYG